MDYQRQPAFFKVRGETFRLTIEKESSLIPPNYVIASCKPWHKVSFELLVATTVGQWEFVSTSDALSSAVLRLSPRYVFFLHWNWHVHSEIWVNYECVCFHMTDVPYGRGGSPLQNLISLGNTQTMLSALRMVEEMDAGPVYAKRPLLLVGRAEEIYYRAGDISFDIIRWMVETEPEPIPQMGEPVVFKRRKPEQSVLPVAGDLIRIYDHIRMLDAPTYPHAFLQYDNCRIEFTNADLQNEEIHANVVIRKTKNGFSK